MSNPLSRYIEFLPQKKPFLFLDEIVELEHEKLARGSITFPAGHAIFENHLPGVPLVPGVIIIEALAQLSGIVLIPREGRPVFGYLAGVEGMRFRRLVRPGETISLRSALERRFGSAARFEVAASVGEESVASGLIAISIGDRNSPGKGQG